MLGIIVSLGDGPTDELRDSLDAGTYGGLVAFDMGDEVEDDE